jgi:hypothetical protein
MHHIAYFEEISVVYREQSKVTPFGGTALVLVLLKGLENMTFFS